MVALADDFKTWIQSGGLRSLFPFLGSPKMEPEILFALPKVDHLPAFAKENCREARFRKKEPPGTAWCL